MRRFIVHSAARRQLPALRVCSPFQQAAIQRNVMSTPAPAPAPVYRHIDDVERLEFYQPGGYHPVGLGNLLNQRYRIVHKLGYGTYSTIWLARDEQRSKFVAVKVGTANAIQMSQKEIDTLTQLTSQSAKKTQCSRFLTLPVLDSFSLTGPNGTHPCFVTLPARCSLSHTISISGPKFFHLKVARALAAQLVQAVAHVHDCGYVHGDIHLGNILLRLPHNLDQMSELQRQEELGPPQLEPVLRTDGKPLPPGVPTHVVPPAWLGLPCEKVTLQEARLLLSDFGTAFRPSHEKRCESYTPFVTRPPEARFEPSKPLSFPSDIWSLAFTMWAIMSQSPLHDNWLMTDDEVTADQVDALGPLPPEWWAKWEAGHELFTKDGRPKDDRDVWSWNQRFEDGIQHPRRKKGMETLGPEEQDAFLEMIRGMLAFRPGERLSARQVLDSSWMKGWGLPEVNSIKDVSAE